jgi:TnpA family transposase
LYVDSPQFQRNIQRALNRGESYHKLVRAVAYANGGKLRVRTDQEQQLWSECSRLLANCIIYYNAASYRNCSSAPSAGRITNGPTRSSERTRQAGSM